jgi:DNA repair protein RadC
MKQSYLFGGMSEPPQRTTSRAEITTIYRWNTREVKVATVRDAPANPVKIDAPEICAQFWRETVTGSQWFDPRKEAMVVLLLSTRYNLEGFTLVSLGSVNESIAHPREIFRPAIVAGVYAIVIMHNHPSGGS